MWKQRHEHLAKLHLLKRILQCRQTPRPTIHPPFVADCGLPLNRQHGQWFVPFLNLRLLQELLIENEAPRTGSGDIPWHHSEPSSSSSSSSSSRKRGPRSQETAHVSPVVVEVVRDLLSDPFAEKQLTVGENTDSAFLTPMIDTHQTTRWQLSVGHFLSLTTAFRQGLASRPLFLTKAATTPTQSQAFYAPPFHIMLMTACI